jgi:DnaJ-class molecular chaperone
MDAPFDPYRELGVSRTASRTEIANAFRLLARRHHPDSRPAAAYAPDSDAAMIRIMAAYMILADMDRRDEYDRTHPEPGQRSKDRPPATVTWIG